MPRPAAPPRRTFALTGPSVRLDPLVHAVRGDIADIRLADRVFAPHYVAGVTRTVAVPATLHGTPARDGAPVASVAVGDTFDLLDVTGDAAWGIACRSGIVGYLPADALGGPDA